MSEQKNNVPQNEMAPEVEAAQTTEATDTEAPATEPEGHSDEVSLAERLTALEKERDEYLDQWRRSAAEFQNFRKREERLRVERERSANTRVLKKLLPVMDDLQRAAQYVPQELTSNDWVNGMLAIERKLWSVLEQESVTTVDSAPGSSFDPTVHEALLSEDSEEVESGHITKELERGYRHGETVLRPARVAVAR
ncbi:MAG: nucleotide exchange factor GrpE [Ardenticatenales bacterium]|nr:nucleotide exchange factor GrpE [Ardenticatenales bacterium]